MTTKPTYPPQTDPNQLTFKVSVSNITPTTAEITVSPSNETKSYFSDIVTDADWLESQKHGFDDYLQYFIEVVMMEQQEMTREEAVKAITSYGNDAYTARGLEPGAKYWAVAVGIDADGHTTTKPTAEAFTAQTAPESTNTFEIATTAITQTGASITVTPSNSDVYFLDVLSADIQSQVPTGTDYQKYLIDRYFGWGMLDMYLHEGPFTYEAKELNPGWEYQIAVFGCEQGFPTTPIKTETFKTLEGGDPQTFDVQFECTLSSVVASKFSTVPSADDVVYIFDLISEEDYQAFGENIEEGMKKVLESKIKDYMGTTGLHAEAVSMLAATGPVEFERNLQTGDQLRMWAVAIDQKGVPVAPFIISETYTVEENTAALAEVSIDSYAWYDGAELAQLDPINFAGFEKYAVLLLKVSHNDKAAHWWTGCFMGDLSNPDEYSDRSIINNLVTYGIPEFKDAVDQLLAVYWDENTICGVAADAEGNYGPVIRQMVNLTKEGASPAGELIGGGLSNINLMDMRQAKFAHR